MSADARRPAADRSGSAAGGARPSAAVRGAFDRLAQRRPKLTGRNVLIAAMVLFLMVILASPFQTYLNRRASVSAAAKQQQQLDARVAELQKETAQWQDPAFVERQARVRLQYVRPGDTLYTVLNAQGQPLTPAVPQTQQVLKADHRPSWNASLWSSVQAADAAH